MNERLTILITEPKVVFQSSTKLRKHSPESIQRDLKWGKMLIAGYIILAFICVIVIFRELTFIHILGTREHPNAAIWLMFLFSMQVFLVPELWMQQSVLKHKLDLLIKGEHGHSSSLNDQLKDILNAKKGIYGIVMLIPVFLISIVAGLIDSSRVIFEPYFTHVSALFVGGFLLLIYDFIKYDRLFKKNVEAYHNLL